jgi:hypothetical protein
LADPTTELSKEFLEFNDYLVRKETKFQKNKKLQGTPSDIDIIAISPKGIQEKELQLRECVIGEVKNWSIREKSTLDEVYKDKFHFIDAQPSIAWQQLKKLIPSKNFEKVIFCFATNQEVYDYALKKYRIKIITVGQMLKHMADFFKTSNRNWTYYPERYNYNAIRALMCYLFNCTKYKDKLTLDDIVWIDPEEDKQYRNRFAKINGKFFEDFVYYQSSGDIFTQLINRMAADYPWWFKEQLKANKKFWQYLTGKQT